MTTKKIGTIGKNGKILLPTLNPKTGERSTGWFSPALLCRLGHGRTHVDDIVVRVFRDAEAI